MQVSSHYISNNYVHWVRYTRTRVISYFFKERVCYIYNHRFRYLTLYIQTTHTLHYFTGIPQNFVTIQQMMLYDNFSDADNTDDTDYLISRPQKRCIR